MKEELLNQIEGLSSSIEIVSLGDISSLAEFLDDMESLRQIAEINGISGLIDPLGALEDVMKRLIMGDSDDDARDMAMVREALSLMKSHMEHGETPPGTAYPEALNISPDLPGGPLTSETHAGETTPVTEEATAMGESTPEPAGDTEMTVVQGSAGAFAGDEELLGEYLSEQRMRLDEIEGILLKLENDTAGANLPELRRALHTIKGDSGFLGLSEVARISHAAETYLDDTTPPYDLEHLFAVKDWLSRAFEDLTNTAGLQASTLNDLDAIVSNLENASGETAPPPAPEPQEEPAAPADVMPEPSIDQVAEPAAEEPEMEEITMEATEDAPPSDAMDMDLPAPAPAPMAADEDLDSSLELDQGSTVDDEHDDLQMIMESDPLPPLDEEQEEATPAPPVMPPPLAAPQSGNGSSGLEGMPASLPLSADESLLVDFISESKEHLDDAGSQLLLLESDSENEEAINSVFRAFHTVKGIAGFLNLQEISVLAHDTENLLDMARRDELELTPKVVDLVFEALDWLIRLIGNVTKALQSDGMLQTEPELSKFIGRLHAAQQGKLEEATKDAPAAPVKKPKMLGEILVESGEMTQDELESAMEKVESSADRSEKLGEVLVKEKVVPPSSVRHALETQQQVGPAPGRKAVELKETLRVDYDRLESMIDTIGELVLAEAMISQDADVLKIHSEDLNKKLYNLRQVSRKLQELGTTIRMVPISGTFQKMARLVRDLSRKSNKSINFTSDGDETELDRAYVDLIADPLVHMIRNAVDHGIETTAEREAAGKSSTGQIQLRAFHEGGNIHVEVRDDGKGLNPDKIFSKAVEKGLVEADEREKLSENEIFQMIFLPGFSTAAAVTEVSGRGVGMDVVRRNINELRGQIQIQSEVGGGTVFKVILPLTLALIDGMLVRVGSERFIFPVLSVVESTRPTKEMVNTVVGKGEMISLRNRQLPMYRLARLFRIPDALEDETQGLVVVVENNGRQIGLVVDDLVGMQQTVIKSLGQGMIETQGLSGGAIMADGTVGLIVDIPGLINIARGRTTSLAAETGMITTDISGVS